MSLSFFFRRIHSLTGLLLIIFLFEHFITNSQASYFLDERNGFIKTVNFFQSIPYLHFIEIALIGIPLFFHAILGIKYIFSFENNCKSSDGTKPVLPFSRNKAYVWQRITSYIVLVLLVFHIVQMRFIRYPMKISMNNQTIFLVKIQKDEKLKPVFKKMDAEIVADKNESFKKPLIDSISKFKLKENQIIIETKQSGQALLLTLRDMLKNPFMIGIYSVFILATSFHAINGLWTFLITWGFIISNRSQKISLNVCFWIFLFVITLGLISVWGSFFN